MDVTIMPGLNDISSTFLPQQPISKYMFTHIKSLITDNKNIVLATNPHSFTLSGINFLGMNGQDMRMHADFKDDIEMLEYTL